MVLCLVVVYVLVGVLDVVVCMCFVQQMYEVFVQVFLVVDVWCVVIFVMLYDVFDGIWGVNGVLWMLFDFVRVVGYVYFQYFVV